MDIRIRNIVNIACQVDLPFFKIQSVYMHVRTFYHQHSLLCLQQYLIQIKRQHIQNTCHHTCLPVINHQLMSLYSLLLFLHPLHPYTKALLSAVPIPDPSLEKHKKLLVYDPSIHDYSVDKPVWEEIANGHFVYGNQRELEGYRKEYESQL